MRQTYKRDPETNKFITKAEFNRKYPEPIRNQAPMTFINNFSPFESPVTGKVINNSREYKYDLQATGCRTYEGTAAEQKEVDRRIASEDKKFESVISNSVDETAHQIRHNYSRPKAGNRVNLTFGE